MHRIDHVTAAVALPAPDPAGAAGYFSHAAPGVGVPTVLTADWANNIQEELMSLLAAAGLVGDKTSNNQVLTAIQSIVGSSAVVGAGAIFGMTLSNAVGFLTTRITCTAGLFRDGTNTAGGVLAAAMTKRLDQVWAPGNNAGGRLTAGALSNGQTYHCFALINPVTGAVEAPVFDTSPTAPNLAGSGAAAAGFTKFRRLGAIVLDVAATTIREFYQLGDWFEYKVRGTDYAAQANGGGAAFYRAFPSLPLGIEGRCRVYFQSTGTADLFLSGLYAPQFGVPPAFGAPSQKATVRRLAFRNTASGVDISYGTVDRAEVLFDTTQHIYTFSSDTAGDVIAAGIEAWEDLRGRFF